MSTECIQTINSLRGGLHSCGQTVSSIVATPTVPIGLDFFSLSPRHDIIRESLLEPLYYF
jgi:hypothetical protein